ncbi:MAG: putative MscS family protein YkuT [Actinobacteria bacterium]|uniref:Moderate conductance mechanosensitive channel n=4 Tax=Candidatus Hakubella thermalkaliphila TaxID=2754717 RepID=A0A6V8Q5J5_9ACTN|nr:mechanosensitive ion channel family protein [Candidatus Hakubella thermalkaliphila]MBT9170562.1 putative MscS family protein YkuT [Actinomycetota bacterium]GFP40005.1 moderate conductance mechanosensitive channel [Candidatus Hakubella thermalkaliphila]
MDQQVTATLWEWMKGPGLRVLFTVVSAALIITALRTLTRFLIRYMEVRGNGLHQMEAQKRAKTLGSIINSTLTVIVAFVALMMILQEFNIKIMPILAGAGIAGLAIGFGAQTLVKDVINGFFILLENQYYVGDIIKVKDVAGAVEGINLRRTVLRDMEGAVHFIPNGQITQVANLTRDWSGLIVEVGVDYKEDIDEVSEVLNQIGQELAQDGEYKDVVLEPPTVVGVIDFSESQVTLRMMGKVVPSKQWGTAQELRRRIKKKFDQAGIEIPFPHRVVISPKKRE